MNIGSEIDENKNVARGNMWNNDARILWFVLKIMRRMNTNGQKIELFIQE